ncbi:hypothetical protein [Sphingomonas sp. RS2018]
MTTEALRTTGWSPWRTAGWGLAALLLLLPAVAMQFTSEVNWTASDFVFAGVLFGGTGLLIELAARRSRLPAYRIASVLAVIAALLLIWVNLAVGIIGDEENPMNLLYVGVLAIGFAGSIGAGFAPRGMARAMATTAAAMALAGAIAVGGSAVGSGIGMAMLHGAFIAMFAVSALLYWRAATQSR